MSRVLVAMSGGVDSSLAAALLVEAGHEVIGATMKTFCYQETPAHGKTCCGLDGILDAKAVADTLGIPHYVFDVEEEFTRDVIDDFVAEYARGRTPNPCVRCNANTKFRDLLRRGRALGCDFIATGHYVRMEHGSDGEPRLLRGLDRNKDQSYFLWGLPRDLLPRLLFPVGELTKPEVRARAGTASLITAEKPESQEICFVPSGDYRGFLAGRLGENHPALEPGPIVDREGRRLGEHAGYAGFTPGQRKGLGGGFSRPLYVLETRPETREVVIGEREELAAAGVVIEAPNLLTRTPLEEGMRLLVQIRHRSPARPAMVVKGPSDGPEKAPGASEAPRDETLHLRFDEPTGPVSPGQSAVLFDGEHVLGGGRIARRIPLSGEVPASPQRPEELPAPRP